MSTIKGDMNLDFNASVQPNEIKNHLVVPIITRKSKIVKDADTVGNLSSLESRLKVGELVIDMRYQRVPNDVKVSKIARNFNKDAVGVIICSMREDGVIAVIDGGHRIAAMNLLGMQDTTIDALVYFGLTIKQEAEIFFTINEDRTKPKTADIFKAKVVANDPEAVGLDSMLKALKLEPANKPGNGYIRGIGTIREIYINAGYDNTYNALLCLKNAYGPHSSSFNVDLVVALAIIFKRYENINKSGVIEALKRFATVDSIVAQAKTMAIGSSRPIRYTTLPFVIVNSYNHKKRANRIEPYNMAIEDKKVWK